MAVKPRKIPMRMCVGCREMKPKMQLLRVVKPQDGEAYIDRKGKAPGRGAYVCSAECFAAACKRNKLDRALKATLGSDDYDRIAADIAAHARDAREM